MTTNRRRKISARRVELSARVVTHLITGHDWPFMDGGLEERELADVSATYHKNAEYIESESRKERGELTRSAAWWGLVGVPQFGLRKQLVESDAKPLPDKGTHLGMPRCWTDWVDVESLFETEADYLARNRLVTPAEREVYDRGRG